jgi:polysaccharide export outer membrane protein
MARLELMACVVLALACPFAAKAADAGGAQPASMVKPPASAAAAVVDAAYRIGPADQLDVAVFQIGDLSRTVQVDSAGNIILPLIGQVTAAGKTADQLATEVADDLKQKYVKNPLVTVTVKDAASQRVTVDGEVVAPGIYSLSGPTTLLQAIALAKGPNPKTADYHRVELYHVVNGARSGQVYDLAAIRDGKAPDPPVAGQDLIVVQGSGSKAFWNRFVEVAPVLTMLRPW